MIEFIKNLTLDDVFVFIGKAVVVLGFIEILFRVIPKFRKLRSKFWNFVACKIKHKRLEKKAIASDIEDVVNEVVLKLQSELPAGWINKVSIKWVDKDIKNKDLINGEMILRIRPLESQDANLINGIYFFFTKVLFPETKEIIPANVCKATALQISRRTINHRKPFLIKQFEKNILTPSIKEDSSIVGYIDKFEDIDNKGFFTGSFLREIHEIAIRSKFKELRNKMDAEVEDVLTHIRGFSNNIANHGNPDWQWSRKGPATSYAFILVAHPFHGGVKTYTNRVIKRLQQGIERIYVMGTSQEKQFAKKVISAISKIPDCYLSEIFDLSKDYRGERGGIGALFVKGAFDQEIDDKIEKYFNDANINTSV